jgi:hypothetical protein
LDPDPDRTDFWLARSGSRSGSKRGKRVQKKVKKLHVLKRWGKKGPEKREKTSCFEALDVLF